MFQKRTHTTSSRSMFYSENLQSSSSG